MDWGVVLEQFTQFAESPLFAGPVGTAIGSIGSLWFRGVLTRQSARQEIAVRLMEVQQNLGELAFSQLPVGEGEPEKFKQLLFRQFFGRIDDAKTLAKEVNLDPSVAVMIGAYKNEVDSFADRWARARRRTEGTRTDSGYWNHYDKTYERLHKLLKRLGKFNKIKTTIGDMPNRDDNGSRKPNTLGYQGG